MPKSQSIKSKISARRRQVLDLVIAGASERSIADTLGISHGQVNKDKRFALGQLADGPEVDAMRDLLRVRYDRLILAYWQQALTGDTDAATQVHKAMNGLRAIYGIDPAKPLVDARTQVLVNADGDRDPREVLASLVDTIAARRDAEEGANRSPA